MQTVAIVGVGLIGGSFGLALRAAGFRGTLLGVSSPATMEAACARGAVDRGVTLAEAAAEADVLYLAQPISRILETLTALGPLVRPGALVTDAGSTKRVIGERARACLPLALFLGGHPMAGKEARGVEAAEAGLFKGRPYLLTGDEAIRGEERVREFTGWVEAIGAAPRWLSEEEHDRLVAAASHAPQLVSTALAAALAAREDAAEVAGVAGPGLVDMTRLAMSSYEIWEDILATNGDEVAAALERVERMVGEVRAALGSNATAEHFAAGEGFARLLRGRRQ